MSANPQRTPSSWTDLTGTILPGGYELKELLQADDVAAQFRVRVLGDRDLDAVAWFLRMIPADAARQVEIWQLVRDLRHPNLATPLGTGVWERSGEELAYLVLRRADEVLDDVLGERALTTDEAKDVLLSVAIGLEALHLNNLVHGCLAPEQILAVGDRIQLPVTCLRPSGVKPSVELIVAQYLAPESVADGENVTPASDIWCLGASLFEALTQKEWTGAEHDRVAELPEPFATIAERCLQDDPSVRCGLAEATALLRGEVKPPARAKLAAAAGAGASSGAPAAIVLPESDLRKAEPAPVDLASPVAQNFAAALVEEAPTVRPNTRQPEIHVDPRHEGSPTALPGQGLVSESVVRPTASPESRPDLGSTRAAEQLPTAPRIPVEPIPIRSRPAPAEAAEPRNHVGPAVVKRPLASATLTQADNRKPYTGISRLWIWAAVAVAAVIVMIWALRPKPVRHISVGPAAVTAAPARQVPAPSATAPAIPAPGEHAPAGKEAASTAAAPAGDTRTIRPDGSATAEGRNEVWRVVIYTYNSKSMAQTKAESINAKHSALHTEVFAPKGESGPYLVTAGTVRTRDEANQVRRRVLSSGLPRDSYVQNYSR